MLATGAQLISTSKLAIQWQVALPSLEAPGETEWEHCWPQAVQKVGRVSCSLP
jgi:hypothetical protein